MHREELKPCPFCGEGKYVRIVAYAGHPADDEPKWHAGCSRCDAGIDGYGTQYTTIAAWNRRADA